MSAIPINTRMIRDRSLMNRTVRDFFDRLEYLEVETPILTPDPIPERHIELFRTDRLYAGGTPDPLYLVPSPEVWMKRLLAAGAPSMYQICRCFRNGEQIDRWHRIEFTMLEWYAVGSTPADNRRVMERLIRTVADAVGGTETPECVGAEFRVMSMEQAFREYAGFSLEADLREAGLDRLDWTSPDWNRSCGIAGSILSSRLARLGQPAGETGEESADDLFHRLLVGVVEEKLPTDRPLLLTDWPVLIPTLAARVPDSPWAQRWELYISGVEVANCYGEERNEEILTAFWKSESEKKLGSGVPVVTGNRWPRIVASGLPACSGAAVGLDRLLAIVRGDGSLEGLDLFPIHDMMRR